VKGNLNEFDGMYVCMFRIVRLYHLFHSLFTRRGGSVTIPSFFAISLLSDQVPFKEVPGPAEIDLMLEGIFSLASYAPPRSSKGVGVPSPFPSETDSEDAMCGAVSTFTPLHPSGP
jgi:hypothetical protein